MGSAASLTSVDVVLLGFLGFAAWKGYKRGFLVEAMATAGLLVAIVAGFMFADLATDLLRAFLGRDGRWLGVVGFVLVVVAVVFAVRLMATVTSKMLRATVFGSVDGGLGALVGALKACISVCVMVWGLTLVGIPVNKVVGKESQVLQPMLNAGRATSGLVFRLLPPLGSLVGEIEDLFAQKKKSILKEQFEEKKEEQKKALRKKPPVQA